MPYFFGLFADEACRGAGAREEKRVKQSEVEAVRRGLGRELERTWQTKKTGRAVRCRQEAISLPPHTDVEKLLWIDQRVSSYPDHQTLCPNARREKEERHFISALYLLTPLK
ncbi:Hypothetical protein SMAX5B_005462, partial [Scophthalmus maximus]